MTTEIDEATIERLVHTFYARVRDDAWLGPVFEARVDNWDRHLARMCDFWSSVTLGTDRYQGQPMRMHLPLPVDGRHFDRWLALFEATAREVCSPEAAEAFLLRARRIATSLELGMASAAGVFYREDLAVLEERECSGSSSSPTRDQAPRDEKQRKTANDEREAPVQPKSHRPQLKTVRLPLWALSSGSRRSMRQR